MVVSKLLLPNQTGHGDPRSMAYHKPQFDSSQMYYFEVNIEHMYLYQLL